MNNSNDDSVRGGWTSASNAEADSLCPGRHLAQKQVPLENESGNDLANYGRAVHAALAGETLTAPLTREQQEVYDKCKAIEQKLFDQFFGGQPLFTLREHRYWVDVIPAFKHSGQADAVFKRGTKALILDYKSLYGDQAESPRNMQLRDLACLVRPSWGLVEGIGVAIVQPLVSESPEICFYDEAALLQAWADLAQRVRRSNDPASKRVAGPVQCKFCRAKPHCTEYQQYVGTMLPQLNMLNLMSVPVGQWTPEQRSRAADALSPAMEFLESVKKEFKAGLAKDPNFIPGWGLRNGSRRESLVDLQVACDRFVSMGGKLPDFMKCLRAAKGDLTDAIAAATGLKGKALEKALREFSEGNVIVSKTEPSLKKL